MDEHRKRKKENGLRAREKRASARAEYDELSKKAMAIEMNRNEDQSYIQEFIHEGITKTDSLYPNVKKNLPGTSSDSKTMRILTRLGHLSSKRITVTRKEFDLSKAIKELKRDLEEEQGKRLSAQEYARYITEDRVSTCFRNPPTFEFFYGTMRPEGLVVKERKKRTREKIVATQPVMAKERNLEAELEQDSTPMEVEHMWEQIREIAQTKPKGVPFFKTIVDPNSFTQTVENIFHFSFLVKEGKVGVSVDEEDDNCAILTLSENKGPTQTQEEGQGPAKRKKTDKNNQSILSFTMEDYKQWIATFDINRRAFEFRSDNN